MSIQFNPILSPEIRPSNAPVQATKSSQNEEVHEHKSSNKYWIKDFEKAKEIMRVFALRPLLGFDLIESYMNRPAYYNQFSGEAPHSYSGVNSVVPEFAQLIQDLLFAPETTQKMDVKNLAVKDLIVSYAEKHYLSDFMSKDEISLFLLQFYTKLTEKISNKTDTMSERELNNELLEELLQTLYEDRVLQSKTKEKYDLRVEKIMGELLLKVFNIYEVMAFDPLIGRHSCELVSDKNYKSNWVCSNVVDLIVYELLLNDNLPLGYIKFLLVPKRVNGTKMSMHLSFFAKNRRLFSYRLLYNLETNIVRVQSSKGSVETLNLKVNKNGVYFISGTLNKRQVEIKIEKRENTFVEKLEIEPWESGRVINHHHLESGYFSDNLLHKNKQLQSRYQVSKNDTQHFVYKTVDIGEDQYVSTTIFSGDVPVPISGSGFIKNMEIKNPGFNVINLNSVRG